MTSRQRVYRTLEFDQPDRVPRHLWTLPIAFADHGADAMNAFSKRWPMDFDYPQLPKPKGNTLRQGDPYVTGTSNDEWGCVFESIQAGVIGEVKNPILDDWSRLDDLHVPNEAICVDVDAVNRFCKDSDKFIIGDDNLLLFERVQFLRGTENVMMDLGEESSELKQLIAIVHEFNLKRMQAWVATDIDAVPVFDDWGSQTGLLINPEQWRRLFKPLYADYVRIAHDAGKKLFMHSDGHIVAIYEDLIQIGVDAINSQLFCMDMDQIARQFKGRITFWGEIDRQHILPFGSVQDAREAVERVVDRLYDPAGGVIAQFELGLAAKLENADAIMQAWQDLPENWQPTERQMQSA